MITLRHLSSCLIMLLSPLHYVKAAIPVHGVVLTFDDESNILNWVDQIPLFAKYGAHVTFFIDAADTLAPEQIIGLRKLAAAGHEIACHGFRHTRSVDLVRAKGVPVFLRTEIDPANAALQALGYRPLTFGYPFSQNDEVSDAALKEIYRHARTGAGLPENATLAQSDIFYTPASEVAARFCFVGKGIDLYTRADVAESLVPALDRVREKQELIVLYAHNIIPQAASHFVTPEALELLLQKIGERGLAVYRLCDLPSEFPN